MSRKHTVRNRICSIAMTGMLLFGLFPPLGLSNVFADSVSTVHAAAYMGAKTTAETTLPDNMEVDGQSAHVTWNIGEDTFGVPYETVTVTGTAGGKAVVANVEVIPPSSHPLVYFVDSGRGGDSGANVPSSSPLYDAVKELTGGHLLNQLPDQKFAGTNDWGFDDSIHKVKNSKDGGHTDPAADSSIWVVGLRAANDHIIYQLKALEAGTYTLSSGFHDWYGSRSRVMRPSIEYLDISGDTQTIHLDQFNTNVTQFISSEFTIPGDIDTSVPMTLTYTYVSGEKPILSWFAIAEGEIKGMIEDARQNAASTVKVLLDGNDIKADNVNGLTFKGFGVLSANSTSALLMDYKAEHPNAYAELLQILFGGDNPIMTHVKIEMGNDRNNSTGPDPATMRTADEDANVTRHPGFQLAADAKAVNPNLKVSILRWNAPAWADNNDKIYTWYKNTILAAFREYGYMVDYVNPHINEHAPDLTWTKQYAERVRTDNTGFTSEEEKTLYHSVEVVISDEVGIGSFGGSMVSDASLRDAVSVAAYHYNTDDDSAGNFKRLAEQFDVEVWNSEAQATFSNSSFRPNNNMKNPAAAGTGIGGTGSALEMGNTIIKGFVNSRRTHFIYQPAIGSFYEGGQYSFKELVSARDPWSGWIHYDAGLLVLQHFSWFAKVSWENGNNDEGIWRAVPQASYTGATGTNPVSGRNGTPSYMTLAAPDKSDFSTVIVNDSEYERIYKLQTVNMAYTGNPSLEVWETRAADKGEAFNSSYMQYLGKVSADGGGIYTVPVKPYSIVTVTTLENNGNNVYHTPLPVEGERTILDTDATGSVQNTGDRILYADDFDYSGKTVPVIGAGGQITGTQGYIESRGGSKGAIPRYTHDRNGAFEAYLDEQTGNYVLRQQLDRGLMGLGGTWNNGEPVTTIGDYRWTNYKASVDVSFETNHTQGGTNYAAIGARYQGGGSSHTINGTPYVLKFWFDGGWQLQADNRSVANGNVVTGSGGVKIDGFDNAYNAWHNIAIQVAGSQVTAYLDGVELASYTDPNPKLSGRVDLGSGYYHVRFDNLLVETVDGYAPYYSEALDDLEMHDLAPVPKTKLVYSGSWAHNNGQGMFHYQRSLSTSQGADAALEYTFIGTGLDILGPNDGSAKLEVTVDGQIVMPSASTLASKELYQTLTLRGLAYEEHTVQIKVLSGTLVVDAIAVISGEVQGAPDTADLQDAFAAAQSINKLDEFRDSDWQLFEAARNAALAALANPVSFRLDQEGAEQLASRLIFAQNQLFTGDIRELSSPHYAAAYAGSPPKLPEMVEATREDGTTTLVTVNWHLDDVSFDTAYETVAVTGTYGSLTTVCYVEVVPKDILYFADLNATAIGLTAGHTSSDTLGYDSPAYSAVAALADAAGKPLLNDAPDRIYDSVKGWGHGGYNASGTPSVYYKGIVNGPYSKQSTTGVYTTDQIGAALTYTFDNLPAGEYKLALGTYSWWSGYSRTEEVYLEYDNKSMLVDIITLDSNSFDTVKEYTFSMAEAGSLTLKLVAAQSNQSPMLSFVGVAPVKIPEADVTKPVITLLGEPVVHLPAGTEYTDAGATAMDDRDGDITDRIVTTVTGSVYGLTAIDTSIPDVYTIRYNVSDDAGNAANEVTRTVIVTEGVEADVTKPVITLLGEPVVRLAVGAGYTDAGATASDDRDGDISDRIVTTVTSGVYGETKLNTSKAGTYTFHYNVNDAAGNAADEVTRTVIVYNKDRDDTATAPSSSAPSAPAVPKSPMKPEIPSNTLVLGADDLRDAVDGIVIIRISENQDTVILPGNIAEVLGDNRLRFTGPTMTIEFPAESLNSIQAVVPGDAAEEAQIHFLMRLVPKDEATRLVRNSAAHLTAQLTAASDMYNFSMYSVGADGTSVPLTAFTKPLTMTFQVDPNADRDLLGIYFIAADGTLEYMGGTLADGIITAKLHHLGNYTVLEYNKMFADVEKSHWAIQAIKRMAAKHIIAGVDDTRFDPQRNVTRAEFAAMLTRALGLTTADPLTFTDVSPDEWYAEAIANASSAGIVHGRDSSTFAPNAVITREEMAVMIVRAYKHLHGAETTAANPSSFSDNDRIEAWAQDAVGAAQAMNLIRGRGNNEFAPKAPMTRAESVQVISKILN
ncbi:S-layer homology domain-containing protein [Paenibacillus bouchesdurhonensis]|uniref:S-layer homology domain-containing protein n=1 Tax=Paenibacillus bouchesdurhonensis TaxID=1870990 RepID=UPI000DA60A9F|nr:S-layer homology domain-containing protein [Paenibacillus bouchesdurhonensis]